MKFLIDEMWSPAVAQQLRARGFDALSAAEEEHLRSLRDEDLLALSSEAGRAIVTENANDFQALAARELRAGRSHAGLVFTSRTAFYRGNPRSVGRLVVALQALIESEVDLMDREIWLQPLDRGAP